jgi:transposase, IS5 family
MVYTENNKQPTFFNFNNILIVDVPPNNPLIRLNKELAWDEMVEIVSKKYSSEKGRNSISIRMMLGLEIAKRKLGLSDEGIIAMLQTDVALKVFCGYDYWYHPIPEPSSLCKFRKRLDEETLNMLEEVNLKRFITKVPLKKNIK